MFSLSLYLNGSAGTCRAPDLTLRRFPRFEARGLNLASAGSSPSLRSWNSRVSGGKISCCSRGNGSDGYSILKKSIRSVAFAVVGSMLFLGRFGCRPALSIVDASAPTEEKLESLEEDDLTARLADANPKDVESLKMAFYEKMKKGRTREAVEYVERLIDAEPDEVEWRLLHALCYELMGRLSRAKNLFNEILEERPLQLRALHGLALVMHKNREGPAVFEMLRKALELARREQRVNEERNIRILIAQMHVVKGDLEGGLVRFQKLAEENPRDFRPYLCQGIIYSLLERNEEAEEQFEIYRSLVPDEFPQRSFLDDVILSAKAEAEGEPKGQPESSN